MLRDVLRIFLNELTEREFDAPMLAMLASQGFTDVHLIHGAFEFGKDIIAKRLDPNTGVLQQFAIQSKAGDIGQSEWRAVRPQLEEAIYNTRAHPNFDETIPRVGVLATTGKLKGAAPVDSQEFRDALRRREPTADFTVWDQESFIEWLTPSPLLASPVDDSDELEQAVLAIRQKRFTEPDLERFSRRWCNPLTRKHIALEAGVLAQGFRLAQRLDMGALTALHLLRAARSMKTADAAFEEFATRLRGSALRLFGAYVDDLLAEIEPLLDDPKSLAWSLADEVSIITYPAVACRLAELFSLCALAERDELDIPGLSERAAHAVSILTSTHPGCLRPISDRFAVSVAAPLVVLARRDRSAARDYLRALAKWVISCYGDSQFGLGISSIDESDEVAVERLLGAALESTKLASRRSSYLATVLLDLLVITGAVDLYGALRKNLSALRVVPSGTSADESIARWRRSGTGVWPEVRIEFEDTPTTTTLVRPHIPAIDALMLASVCRSRHDATSIRALVED